MDVAGAQAIKLVAGVDHRLRFERCRRAVEIDAGIGQRRKLRAKVRRVECVHGIPRINTAIVAQFAGRQGLCVLWNCPNVTPRGSKRVMLKSVGFVF
jgi:hypothetical protein